MENNDQLIKQQIMIERKNKEELEEEERKKKERQRIAALYYFTAAYLDIVEQKRIIASMQKFERYKFFQALDLPRKESLAQCAKFCMQYALINKKFIENKREYFKADIEEAALENVRKGLIKLHLPEDSFSTIVMCAAKKYLQKFCDKIMGKGLPPKEEKEIADIKQKATMAVISVLTGNKATDIKDLAVVLKEGLAASCENFANAKNDEEAIQWSSMTQEILFVFEKKPELVAESGITQKQLSIANRISELGDDARKGMMALEVLMAGEANEKLGITPEQRSLMLQTAYKVKINVIEKQELAKHWDEPEIKPQILEKKTEVEAPVLKRDN